jgi:hypothetical protein
MRAKSILVFASLVIVVALGNAQEVVSVAVSPGSESEIGIVTVRCPTFSWSLIQWAVGYRVAVFEATTANVRGYEAMAAAAVQVPTTVIQEHQMIVQKQQKTIDEPRKQMAELKRKTKSGKQDFN